MAKYSLELKLKVVGEYLSGTISIKSLAKKYSIKSTAQIRRWIHAYQVLGVDGLKRPRKNNEYSVDFKLKAITMYESSEKSYQDVADELGLNNSCLIVNWRKTYHEQGIDGLSRKQGRPSLTKSDDSKQLYPTPKKPEKIDSLELANQRIQELEYALKMQTIKNEYLEMLRSLRQQKAMKTRQESSTSSDNKKDSH